MSAFHYGTITLLVSLSKDPVILIIATIALVFITIIRYHYKIKKEQNRHLELLESEKNRNMEELRKLELEKLKLKYLRELDMTILDLKEKPSVYITKDEGFRKVISY